MSFWSPPTRGFDIFQLDVDTRWGSTLVMLRSFIEGTSILFKVVEAQPELFEDYDGDLPTVEDVHYAKAAIEVLGPFEAVTTLVGGDTYCTLARVPDAVDQLMYVLRPQTKDNGYVAPLRATMLKAAKFKFEPLFSKANLATMAAYVHPEMARRLFNRTYISDKVTEDIEKCLVSEAVAMAEVDDKDDNDDDDDDDGRNGSKRRSSASSVFAAPSVRETKTVIIAEITAELKAYKNGILALDDETLEEEKKAFKKKKTSGDNEDFGVWFWYVCSHARCDAVANDDRKAHDTLQVVSSFGARGPAVAWHSSLVGSVRAHVL